MILNLIFALANLLVLSSSFSIHSKGCELGVKPVRNFNMDSMKGLWYVIEKTGDNPNCLTYNITRDSDSKHYNLEIGSTTSYFGIKDNRKENMVIVVDDEKTPGSLTIKNSKNNDETDAVFMTDYTNYAGLYSCHKKIFGSTHEVIILSRTPTLYKLYLEQIRSRLLNSKIYVSLSTVSQRDCPNRRRQGFRYY